MKKRLGEFTLDEVKAVCEKHETCRNCAFYSGVDIEAQKCLVHIKSQYDVEIEMPKPKKYRPFKDSDELVSGFKRRFNPRVPDYAMPLIWVNEKKHGKKALILVFKQNSVVFSDWLDTIDFSHLLASFEFLDGSPCGVEDVADENNT